MNLLELSSHPLHLFRVYHFVLQQMATSPCLYVLHYLPVLDVLNLRSFLQIMQVNLSVLGQISLNSLSFLNLSQSLESPFLDLDFLFVEDLVAHDGEDGHPSHDDKKVLIAALGV